MIYRTLVVVALLVGCLSVTIALSPSRPTRTSKASSTTSNEEHQGSSNQNRRGFLTTAGLIGAAALVGETICPTLAVAEEEEQDIEVYFGCGCFWHVQHEFVEAERKILGRTDKELTARAGYAGGKGGAKDGKVCYHNALQVSDYGSLGHAEVVRLTIPPSSVPAFCQEYFALFNDKGYRPDQFGDVGLEYRNLVGFPGGVGSSYAKELVRVSQENGDKLDFAKGKGDDPDRRALCFVMDSTEFPFYVAEQYHQFHDGFNWGENYPNSYNSLASQLSKANVLGESKCPNGLIGVGALGL